MEADVRRRLRQRRGLPRAVDPPAALQQALDARGDVHRVAVVVRLSITFDVRRSAGVHADADREVRDWVVPQTALDFGHAEHRILCALERDHERVAVRLDLESAVLVEQRADPLVVRVEELFAVAPVAVMLAVRGDEIVANAVEPTMSVNINVTVPVGGC